MAKTFDTTKPYPKKCPLCNSKKIAVGSKGFHCLNCDYKNFRKIDDGIMPTQD